MDRRPPENRPPKNTEEAIPADPDVDQRADGRGKIRPVHLRVTFVAVVLFGGTLGTLARYGLESVLPAPDGWPLPTLLVNISGAFLLGIILEAVLRRGPDAGRLRLIRLAAGTGFLGAFTTYSTLALDAVQLGLAQNYVGTALYLLLSLFGGVLASAAGIWAASAQHRRIAAQPANTERQNR